MIQHRAEFLTAVAAAFVAILVAAVALVGATSSTAMLHVALRFHG
jgi:hypothetical protein